MKFMPCSLKRADESWWQQFSVEFQTHSICVNKKVEVRGEEAGIEKGRLNFL